ncbi:hypothetical protein ACJMK2_011311 [Sinanodonta woodiana]|uniref:Replication factor A protein 3 n=1 Tax=Sinanodonta woodiana TaxID=1069815 RepID=A0ABD3V6H4_SINWO
MDRRGMPSSGEPVLIGEILQKLADKTAELDGKSVKITGRLEDHDVQNCTTRITDPQTASSITVDTRLIEPFTVKSGSLVQVIGELDCLVDNHPVVLKAVIIRCVDGLDITMYKKALESQRQYFSNRDKT